MNQNVGMRVNMALLSIPLFVTNLFAAINHQIQNERALPIGSLGLKIGQYAILPIAKFPLPENSRYSGLKGQLDAWSESVMASSNELRDTTVELLAGTQNINSMAIFREQYVQIHDAIAAFELSYGPALDSWERTKIDEVWKAVAHNMLHIRRMGASVFAENEVTKFFHGILSESRPDSVPAFADPVYWIPSGLHKPLKH